MYRFTLGEQLTPGEYVLAEVLPDGLSYFVWDFGGWGRGGRGHKGEKVGVQLTAESQRLTAVMPTTKLHAFCAPVAYRGHRTKPVFRRENKPLGGATSGW